jgi:hypothetical protein
MPKPKKTRRKRKNEKQNFFLSFLINICEVSSPVSFERRFTSHERRDTSHSLIMSSIFIRLRRHCRPIWVVAFCRRVGYNKNMIRKVVNKLTLKDSSSVKRELAYWLSKPAEERIAAVETLRRQMNGSSERLQRTVSVIQRTQG